MAETRDKSTIMQIVKTADGSTTLFHPQVGENYHSKHGALQESKHVFVQSGLAYLLQLYPLSSSINILEVGFGTGLNYLMTADYCTRHSIDMHYTGIELFPVSKELILQLGNIQYASTEIGNEFLDIYETAQKRTVKTQHGSLSIKICDVATCNIEESIDLLYFDAFAAVHQPEMWSRETLEHVCKYLKRGGVFVTYAITGKLKRTMKSLGFRIEKAPGAPGKREMLRAIKI